MHRIYTIDYLRGLLALSVVFYHYTSWTTGDPIAETILGRLGIYAVSAFFVISGISIYLSYHNCKWNKETTKGFFIRRFFRLAPVYWIALFLVMFLQYLSHGELTSSFVSYFNNFSLLFGFYSKRSYLVTGGWSIGVEVVFYALFPLMLFFFKSIKKMILLIFISVLFLAFYAFLVIDSNKNPYEVWRYYINPFNQMLFFIAGMVIAKYANQLRELLKNKYCYLMLFFSLFIFALIPASGTWVSIATGWERLTFTFITIVVVATTLSIKVEKDNLITKSLHFLGNISYPLYLLHGIFFDITAYYLSESLISFSDEERKMMALFILLPIVMLFSYIVFVKIEMPLIKQAKKITIIERVKV
ncbi:acyltransferase family protein [Providencia rettgeri]